MSILGALILGIIQGLTEFLPVSSSGHLVIFQRFLTVDKPLQMFFDVTVHLGTLLAIIIFFFKDVKNLSLIFLRNLIMPFRWKQAFLSEPGFRLIVFLFTSTMITGVVGVCFKNRLEIMFDKPEFVAVNLIFTGLILLVSERISIKSGNKVLEKLTFKCALIIGAVQSVALMPGISRSGITIAGALMLGFVQKDAARYSFLLAIPAIAGAFLLELKDIIESGFNSQWLLPVAVGFVCSAIAGVAAIKLILLVLKEKKLFLFAIYCWILSTAIFLFL